jgi:phospholipid/cholesterol/gamma-HCH transport system permease protein
MHFATETDGGTLRLVPEGDWCAVDVGAIVRELEALPFGGLKQLAIATSRLDRLDPSGAWLLCDLERRATRSGLEVLWPDGRPEPVQLVAETLTDADIAELGHADGSVSALRRPHQAAAEAVGKRFLRSTRGLRAGLAFVGETAATAAGAVPHPRRWRYTSIARHVYDTGITAIPIVALIAFLIAVITSYMGAQQLRKFGADIFVVDLITVGTLREMAVLLTAIIVAGRSGSAFAAEIGAMRLNEEVDALKATGVSPFEVLILPRIIGLVIALPLLTVVADAVGLAGGALLCRFLLDMPFVQFITRMDEAIGPYTFWVGIWKAPVFAILIAAAGCYRGLQVRGSSRELGRLTTVAVVQAIFLVILADALFAVLFMELDI